MKAKVIEIRWHWKELCEPVLSVDHHPTQRRIATAGVDSAVKIWEYTDAEDGFFSFTFISCLSLSRENQPVNVVRYAQKGEALVSAHDGGLVVLWKKQDRPPGSAASSSSSAGLLEQHEDQVHNTEFWQVARLFRGHSDDVFSLAISPDSRHILSGSVDCSTMVWELASGKQLQKFTDHAHYVQGVAWDPLNVYAASQSSDRTVLAYVDVTKKVLTKDAKPVRRRELKLELDGTLSRDEEVNGPRYFRDEQAGTFYRRLNWSPDGLFLVTSCGQFKAASADEGFVNCAYVFLRGAWDSALLCLPVPASDDETPHPVVGARWSPAFYKSAAETAAESPWKLSHYRMVVAVYTSSVVLFYDTASAEPLAVITNLHLSTITDVAWAPNGLSVMIASKDGYVSVVRFESSELGETWDLGATDTPEGLPAALQAVRQVRAELEAEPDVPGQPSSAASGAGPIMAPAESAPAELLMGLAPEAGSAAEHPAEAEAGAQDPKEDLKAAEPMEVDPV
eukprot:RCo029942